MASKEKATCPEIIGKTKKGTDLKTSLSLCYLIYSYVIGGVPIRGIVESSQSRGRIQQCQ